eukprot:3640719-Prymnesium_polylepis.1
MSKPQLLKRKWSDDMTRNVRAHGSRYANVCESRGETKRAKAHGETFALKLLKLRKWPPSGRPKAAK